MTTIDNNSILSDWREADQFSVCFAFAFASSNLQQSEKHKILSTKPLNRE